MAAQSGLCRTWSEIPKTGFLLSRLIFKGGLTLPSSYVVESVLILKVLGGIFISTFDGKGLKGKH